ncbi:FkbM family methyltransferase [Runella sp. CRIBMP]|uniref:FkbM family methyltransferase n=1 Tax=Runella sp. CRIBMP TaxID=2683261 RepID=UPI001411CD2F|nr:FkbM family methyltransferase [Runella sp. CRIBMP]NBB22937.1 FkbM family methyltransferase [Runella sp. CRIBMP]
MSVIEKVRRLSIKLIKQILFKIESRPIFSEELEIKNYGFEVENSDNHKQVNLYGFPVKLRNQSSDFLVFQQVFIKGEYRKVIEIINENKISINTVMDLGANIGLTTLFLFQYFPKANFICVEPDEENYKLLRFNLLPLKNTQVYKNAVWSEYKEIHLNRNFRDQKDWSISVSENNQESYSKVQTVTINDLVKGNNIDIIDLLKIDIEGSEKELFKDVVSASFLDFTRVLAIEIHDEFDVRYKIISELLNRKFILINETETLIAINTALI